MKIKEGLCLVLIFTESGIASPLPWMIPALNNHVRRALFPFEVGDLSRETVNLMSSVKNAKSSQELGFAQHASSETAEGAKSAFNIDTVRPQMGPQPLEMRKSCPGATLKKRWHLGLRRRGCAASLGRGLTLFAQKLQDTGQNLQKFDTYFSKLTGPQRVKWFGRKILGGMRNVLNLSLGAVYLLSNVVWNTGKKGFQIGKMAGKGVVKGGVIAGKGVAKGGKTVGQGLITSGKAVGKGVLTVGSILLAGVVLGGALTVGVISKALKLMRTGFFKTWLAFGKGLKATGNAFGKAGDKMEIQAATRLQKSKSGPFTRRPVSEETHVVKRRVAPRELSQLS